MPEQSVRSGAKAGFDLTLPFGADRELEYGVPEPPALSALGGGARTVEQALRAGPCTFAMLMAATGSRDGREIVVQLEALRAAGAIEHRADGRYAWKG